MSPLASVLDFKHEALVLKFARKNNLSIVSSEELFNQMLKWLWFLANRGKGDAQPRGFPTFPAQAPLDIYWHEFILDTRAYLDFCSAHLGGFLHHCPTPEGLEGASHELFSTIPQKQYEINQKIMRSAMREVKATMGLETMLLWYVQLHKKYPNLV
jgi:hypothetical protein